MIDPIPDFLLCPTAIDQGSLQVRKFTEAGERLVMVSVSIPEEWHAELENRQEPPAQAIADFFPRRAIELFTDTAHPPHGTSQQTAEKQLRATVAAYTGTARDWPGRFTFTLPGDAWDAPSAIAARLRLDLPALVRLMIRDLIEAKSTDRS